MNLFAGLHEDARALQDEALALRRRLHERPELGLLLPETQRAVLDWLAGCDVEVETGGKTSAVLAILRGERPGPTLLLRADMDALPLQEQTGLPFCSRHDGAMHACGHDAHVAMLAGAVRLLAARRESLAGTVCFLFQPGEEGYAGARVLIEEGLLEREPRIGSAFAIHVNPMLPLGKVATRPGPLLAAGDVFSIDLTGRGGHASQPHEARDPIPVACEMVTALQALVTRRMHAFDPVVVSVTRIQAGSAANIIPETAHLLGTVRSISAPARRAVHEKMQQLVAGIAAAHGIEAKLHWLPGYPVTVNDADFTAFTREVARELFGGEVLLDMAAPVMGAEDFSYLLERVPGAMVFLGARPAEGDAHPLHSSRMCIDESVLAAGMALHAAIALRRLAPD